MSKRKGGSRRRHVPQRTCVGCRQVRPKREMIRIVRTPDDGVKVDTTGKLSGRGAYLCPRASCWHEALAKGRLDFALKTTLSPEEQSMLAAIAADLPTDAETSGDV